MLDVKKLLPLFVLVVGTACGGCDDPVVVVDDVLVIDDTGSDAGDTSDTSDVPDATPDLGPNDPDVGDDTRENPDVGDTAPDVPDMMVDEFLTCQADCNYMGPGADRFDCDFDGLSQTEEIVLGTDPCDNDTDGDRLNDRDELQQGTDPLLDDSDGDGLLDADEIFFGFDPNNPDSIGDGVLDGDRWVVHACDAPVQTEPVNYYFSPKGDWQVGLPPAFNNYSELTISSAIPQDKIAAAVFDDPANEVTGLLLSDSPTANQTSPVDVLLDVRQNLNQTFTLLQDTTGGEFATHDFNQAAIGRYLLRSNQVRSARQVRDQIMFAIAPFGSADVTGLPNSSGNTYLEFRVFVSVAYRSDTNVGDRLIINAAIAPAEKFDSRDKVKFRMDDLTNTTNVAQAEDQLTSRCRTFRAGEEDPTADFYWVLDQSGSMSDNFDEVKAVANPFFANLQNTALDYRLGVTTMDEDFFGRPRGNVGWFTDLPTFIAEIDEVSNGNYDCCDEYGLKAAKDGIEWMRSTQAPQNLRIRPNAQLITVMMSDEEAQTFQNNGGVNSSAGQQALLQFNQFFVPNTIVFSIVGDGSGCGQDGEAYRQVAFATGGTDTSLCATDVQETIDDIIFAATGLASNYRLGQTPISSSLRVFKNSEWVPRSRANGFDYFAQTNSIAFFGSYRPEPADPTMGRYGDDIAVSFATYRNTTKNE